MRRISTALCAVGLAVAAHAATAQQPAQEGSPAAVLTVTPVALATVEAQGDPALRATSRDLTDQLSRALAEDNTVRVVVPGGAKGRDEHAAPMAPVYRLEPVLERAGREQLVLSWRLVGPGEQELMTGRERVVRGQEGATADAIARTVLKRVHTR